MRKHVTVYIDEEVWQWAKDTSWAMRKSGSRYLEDLIREQMDRNPNVSSEREMGEDDVTTPGQNVLEQKKKPKKLKSSGYFNPQLKGVKGGRS